MARVWGAPNEMQSVRSSQDIFIGRTRRRRRAVWQHRFCPPGECSLHDDRPIALRFLFQADVMLTPRQTPSLSSIDGPASRHAHNRGRLRLRPRPVGVHSRPIRVHWAEHCGPSRWRRGDYARNHMQPPLSARNPTHTGSCVFGRRSRRCSRSVPILKHGGVHQAIGSEHVADIITWRSTRGGGERTPGCRRRERQPPSNAVRSRASSKRCCRNVAVGEMFNGAHRRTIPGFHQTRQPGAARAV